MAASCHLLRLPFPNRPTFRSIAPSRLTSYSSSSPCWGEARLLLLPVPVLHASPSAAAGPAAHGARLQRAGLQLRLQRAGDGGGRRAGEGAAAAVSEGGHQGGGNPGVQVSVLLREQAGGKEAQGPGSRPPEPQELMCLEETIRSGARSGSSSSTSDSSSKQAVEDHDNWDMPEGDLPC